MGIFGNKDQKCDFSHLSGLLQFKYNTVVTVRQNDELGRLEIKRMFQKEEPLTIQYSQILGCSAVKNLKIAKDGNNVVGNALLGGLILGPLGAIVGGMSGIGNNERIIPKCFVLNYHPAGTPDETKAIVFEAVNSSVRWEKFVETLSEKASCESVPAQATAL